MIVEIDNLFSNFETSFALYTGQTLLDYNGDGECCTSTNHAPLLVGYGTDPKFDVYWLVKNS